MEKKVTMTFNDKEIEDLESLVGWGTAADDHEDFLALEKRVREAKESREVTMTFTEEELADLLASLECSDSVDNHPDYKALYERIKAENEKLEEDSDDEDDDEVKTAVYFTEEELKDLLNCVKHKLSYTIHPDYHDLKHKLKEEVDNFPMNPVNNDSHDDVADSMKHCFQIHFGEDKKDDISLDSKIGKKCNVFSLYHEDHRGWTNDKRCTWIFRGIEGGNYVIEWVPADEEKERLPPELYYFPRSAVNITFKIRDL